MSSQWQLLTPAKIPQDFLEAVRSYTQNSSGEYAAQLLWQRGIQEIEQLSGFLNPDEYQPTSPFAFGEEMERAVERLSMARNNAEKVIIWGDFDADGITSTSVLWEGLGQFFEQHQTLNYTIPNRLTESHGLNITGIDRAAEQGTTLIVTCDTGSTNLEEIDYANSLGIEVIVTDHHTLPPERPPVVAIINPRYLPEESPLFHLSGVAVAYKLVEAMYATLPEIPQNPLEELLDLVAIGLIADLVQLSGDCRYLAQRGIVQLQKQTRNPTRPGVAKLLELCQRTGDRPTDISFGLGPRINAVSRIHGDASFCVELLTSRDKKRCNELALETELANTRRKELQKNVVQSVGKKLQQIDLSTTSVIVLEDSQWSGGVLGLVAGQVAQEYGRPTILLTTGIEGELARGSARSVARIDLYQLVKSQEHLLHRFGGHPFAAGLSLLVENLPLFRDGINQQLRSQIGDVAAMGTTVCADLEVTVAALGKELFRELKLLEPCGMGNPVPKLLIRDCWFSEVWNNNAKDFRGKKVQYIKTTFTVCDDSCPEGFPGIWWGHYKEELPQDRGCDAIAQLDYNTYHQRYEVRLVAVRLSEEGSQFEGIGDRQDWIVDWRGESYDRAETSDYILLENCPVSWDEVHQSFRRAVAQKSPKLALAYPSPASPSPQTLWQTLVGIAKYLQRTGEMATLAQIEEKLNLTPSTLKLGFNALRAIGFEIEQEKDRVRICGWNDPHATSEPTIEKFLGAIAEEQFQHQYFYQVSVSTVQRLVSPNLF
ncbi:single-stranded-DNA-specific exonuclease RecJ [Lusitaniella coriacea]|uniref:single-stranded-DNA-specific exonuclease RecJ n=1 Tax=Lusitaniella coriacea TaxID=1983105 RepID=UPI003CF3A3F8